MAVVASAVGDVRAQEPPAAVALIEAIATDDGVRLEGRALALTRGRYDARMTIEKSGASGRTSTTQGGAVDLAAGQSASVATVGLSMAAGDVLAVELVLTAEGEEVSRNRLSVGQ